MKKVILFIFVFLLSISTSSIFAGSIDELREEQEWAQSIMGTVIYPDANKNNEWLKNNYPPDYEEIMTEISKGNFQEARKIADTLALKLEIGYEGEPYFDGEKIFSISNLIKKEVKKVFKSKDLERKKLFILKNNFDDIGIKNYKKIAYEKDFIFSEEIQTKIKNKLDSLKEVTKKEKFRKKLLKYKLVREE